MRIEIEIDEKIRRIVDEAENLRKISRASIAISADAACTIHGGSREDFILVCKELTRRRTEGLKHEISTPPVKKVRK